MMKSNDLASSYCNITLLYDTKQLQDCLDISNTNQTDVLRNSKLLSWYFYDTMRNKHIKKT